MQFFDAFVIGIFRTDPGQLHNTFPVNGKWIAETIEIPILKQCHIKAHMRRCEPVFRTNERKKGIEVPNVVHSMALP